MCEQTEINYLTGEVVWVKLGSCWWPGEVVSLEALPPDVVESFRKPPIAVVKFFLEDTYEYVKNINSIYKYNCSRKDEFIKKGLYMFRTKHGHMEKFPEDVIRAETAVGGDIEILKRDEFQEAKKESYAGLFGDPKKTPFSAKKGKAGRGRPRAESPIFSTPTRKIKEKTDYKVHILVQGSKGPVEQTLETTTPSTSSAAYTRENPTENKSQDENASQNKDKQNETINENNDDQDTSISTPLTSIPLPSTPAPSTSRPNSSSTGIYACHACPFTTTRMNVLILHNKTHSVSFMPYTPSPVRKKVISKSPPKSSKSIKSPKPRKPRKEKTDKPPKKTQGKKRASQEITPTEVKKPKTDEEIKSSLLADWDDDIDDESNDESSAMVSIQSPEVPIGSESPAVPTPAELPSAQVPGEIYPVVDKNSSSPPSTDKPESSSDSKYEFCENEDWPEEADIGRKIPRVKNPIRTDDTKSVSIDEDEVAREVAELLNKTAVPELPSVPEPLKIEENFPERSIVKSPDKKEDEKGPEKPVEKSVTDTAPSKVIFKTKTFFRSRHSRSQDAIGKYVAEQLNAVEKMDIADNDINGSEAVSSPEARDSPPIEPVKVARLAPKIQLKKMKAEAAQLREKEKMCIDQVTEVPVIDKSTNSFTESKNTEVLPPEEEILESNNIESTLSPIKDVVYPTQAIQPLNETDTFEECEEPLTNTEVLSTTENKESTQEEGTGSYDQHEVRKFEDGSPILAGTYVEEPSKLCIENSNENIKESGVQEHDINVTKLLEESLPSNEEQIAADLPLTESSENNIGPYMNESTASAVDALLSVSREPDRVPRVVTNDLPEDLFEDDNKDSETNEVNYFNENTSQVGFLVGNSLEQPLEEVKSVPEQVDEITEMSEVHNNEVVIDSIDNDTIDLQENNVPDNNIQPLDETVKNTNEEPLAENKPTESDLQIAEALMNLPATAIQVNASSEIEENVTIPFSVENDNIEVPDLEQVVINETEIPMQENEAIESVVEVENSDILSNRFETEHEKSENLNAAQSLVQMSELIDHKALSKLDVDPKKIDSGTNVPKQNNGIDSGVNSVEQNIALLASDNNSQPIKPKTNTYDQSSSKLLKILEEPCKPKLTAIKTTTPGKQIIMQGKDKILNFDVAKSTFKSKTPKQKIIIRRTTPTTATKTVLNNVSDLTASDKIILSRSGNPTQDGSGVQTFTIKTSPDQPSDANTIIIQQKIRKPSKPTLIQPKLQKIKPQTSLITSVNELKQQTKTPQQTTDEAIFDINSMPIVLSEDLLTPESIEKMPVVMSDANIISQNQSKTKVIKPKQSIIEHEKVSISPTPHKQELKTLLLNPVGEVTKSVTPNILSKSSKLRGAKPMLVIDKTGKQKLIMTKSEPTVKELKQPQTLIQSPQQAAKTEKFIILPTQSPTPRPTRTQKIVIDPQTGKAHVFVAKGSDAPISADNKPVSAKLVPSNSDASAPGNTVMIITNAQGAQSRIVLTPEHEKILFPNKQQPKITHLKTVAHRISSASAQKTVTTIAPVKTHSLTSVKTAAKPPARIVPKPKSAIITSKGQLIVGGRVATTAHNIAPMPELRPVTKRNIITSEPKKLIQKSTSEPIIFLQQKSGAMMQLTASQFEHMQRTGQIIQQKVAAAPVQEKVVIVNKSSNDPGSGIKSRARKTASDSPTPSKKIKHEIAIAPAPSPSVVPALAPVSNVHPPALVPTVSNNVSVASSSAFAEFENFEELLPSTSIARQPEPAPSVVPEPPAPPAPAPAPAAAPPAPLSDGQLLAVPGEHFGGLVGTFYLCVEDNGTFTPIDNRPLVLENNQLVPMSEPPPPQPERRDILEAALANSDVFHAEGPRDEAPDFRDLNANVSVHCRVSETSTTLNQPIMTPVEVPSKAAELAVHSSMEDGLAVIGVTPHVPTSLELPITVTDPRIAPKTTDPLSGNNYGAPLREPYAGAEPISMPLLTDEESVGKSMPILTEEAARSPCDMDEGWTRRLLAPDSRSDSSDTSGEIPLQPHIQLSVAHLHPDRS